MALPFSVDSPHRTGFKSYLAFRRFDSDSLLKFAIQGFGEGHTDPPATRDSPVTHEMKIDRNAVIRNPVFELRRKDLWTGKH